MHYCSFMNVYNILLSHICPCRPRVYTPSTENTFTYKTCSLLKRLWKQSDIIARYILYKLPSFHHLIYVRRAIFPNRLLLNDRRNTHPIWLKLSTKSHPIGLLTTHRGIRDFEFTTLQALKIFPTRIYIYIYIYTCTRGARIKYRPIHHIDTASFSWHRATVHTHLSIVPTASHRRQTDRSILKKHTRKAAIAKSKSNCKQWRALRVVWDRPAFDTGLRTLISTLHTWWSWVTSIHCSESFWLYIYYALNVKLK